MIYRKKYLDKFNLKFLHIYKNSLNKKLINSWRKNYAQIYQKKYAFYMQNSYVNKDCRFYGSQNKLVCFITYNTKVPSKRLLLSRFFLVKHSNSLLLGGYQK